MSKNKDYFHLKGLVSNSSLGWLLKSVRKFKKFLDGTIDESTSYFKFGTLMHMYILENDLFNKEVAVIDYITPKSPQQKKFCEDFVQYKKKNTIKKAAITAYQDSYKISGKEEVWHEKAVGLHKELKQYIKYLSTTPNKQVISTKDYEKLKDIEREVKGHKMASKLLYGESKVIDTGVDHYNELVVLWEYNKIKCKSMLDKVIVDRNNKTIILVDLKSTANLTTFDESFTTYEYARQLAFYWMAIQKQSKELFDISNLEEWKAETKIVAIDKISNEVKTFPITDSKIFIAAKDLKHLLRKATWHITNNKWDYSQEYYEGNGEEQL